MNHNPDGVLALRAVAQPLRAWPDLFCPDAGLRLENAFDQMHVAVAILLVSLQFRWPVSLNLGRQTPAWAVPVHWPDCRGSKWSGSDTLRTGCLFATKRHSKEAPASCHERSGFRTATEVWTKSDKLTVGC